MSLPGAWPDSSNESGTTHSDVRTESMEPKKIQSRQPGLQSRSDNTVVIAVMGVTGAGKSTFIETVTGRKAGVGDSLESETSTITSFDLFHKGVRYVLIDTPGFNDTERPDAEITTLILSWLTESFTAGTRLNGVIYLHRIVDPRMSGTALRNTRMFRKLVGDDGFKNVLLTTTFWESVPAKIGAAREAELRSNRDFWGAMIDKGATLARLPSKGDRTAALGLLEQMATRDKFVPDAVDEVVNQGKKLSDTAAAAEQRAQAEALIKQLEARKRAEEAKMQEDLRRRARERQAELRRQQEALERRRRQQQEAERRRQEEENRREEERHRREREELQREIWRQEERRKQQAEELERQRKAEDKRRQDEEAAIRRRFRENYRCIGHQAKWPCDKCKGSITATSHYYHCCFCDRDMYFQCGNCGGNCGVAEHPWMTRRDVISRQDDDICVVM